MAREWRETGLNANNQLFTLSFFVVGTSPKETMDLATDRFELVRPFTPSPLSWTPLGGRVISALEQTRSYSFPRILVVAGVVIPMAGIVLV
ncbi:MAG: hypothetical protein ABGY24_10770 [bacterium]